MIDILNLVYIMIFSPLVCAAILMFFKLVPIKLPQYGNFAMSLITSIFTFAISLLLFDYSITYNGYALENNYPICIIKNIPL